MYKNLTVVLQGALTPMTECTIKQWRACAEGCEIVLSTWSYNSELEALVDVYVVSPDPGVFPVIYNGETLRTENTNRQIVSSIAGIRNANREVSIKWRTDFEFCSNKMRNFLSHYLPLVSSKHYDKLVVFSINSCNPFAGLGLVAQISDWMYFGRTCLLLDLLPSMPIPLIPENLEVPHKVIVERAFPIARFSAEQWMLREGLARVYGLDIKYFDDSSAIFSYLNLVGNKILFKNPSIVGLVTHKYDYTFQPRFSTLRAFIGFQLSTISESDSTLLGIEPLRYFAILLLKTKGLLFNLLKSFTKRLHSLR